MAFVSRSDRKYILSNPDYTEVGPGEYMSQDIPRSQTESKAPFNSKTYRNYKLIKEDIPGPGSYFRNGREISPPRLIEKDKSFENEKSIIYSLDGTLNISNDISLIKELKKKPAFGSAIKRFYNQNLKINETPGPGVYYKDDSFITAINNHKSLNKTNLNKTSPKNTLSSSKLSTIPSKLHAFGYNFNEKGNITVNEDPLKNFKHLGTKKDSVGPGSYNVDNPSSWVKNTLDWSKSLKENNSESIHPLTSLGNSMLLKEITDEVKMEINNKLGKEGKVFKADKNNVFKYFFRKRPKVQTLDMDLCEEKFYEQSPGPGYYHNEIPKEMFKKEKFQFFGSSSDRFKDVLPNQKYPKVGPASYFVDRIKSISEVDKYKKQIHLEKHVQNERENLPISNSPGPGYYNLPRNFGKLHVSSVSDFGSRVKRFTNLNKETDSNTEIVKETYSPVSKSLKKIEKNFLNKLGKKLSDKKSVKTEVKRVFDVKEIISPPVGSYEPHIYFSISSKVMKKVAQSDNENSPFLSSIQNRFDYDLDESKRILGPGYYYRERKCKPIQSKAPFNISQKKSEIPKFPDQPSPCEYDPLDYYEWNKKSFNILFK